jgi:hypothetical protein
MNNNGQVKEMGKEYGRVKGRRCRSRGMKE